MANPISNSYAVFKESFLVLCKDKKMLLFPVLAGITCSVAILGFVLPVFIGGELVSLASAALFFGGYLTVYFICIFFSSAMIIYASLKIKGEQASILRAIKFAGRKIIKILLWSLFSATIGIVVELFNLITREKFDFLSSLIGITWSLATFFVIPVMVFENKYPFAALRGSVELFKQRWGQAINGIVGIGLSLIILGVAGLLLLIGVLVTLSDIIFFSAFFLFAFYIVFLGILYTTLNSIYIAALYHFSTTGEIRGGFSEAAIRNAIH